MNEFRLSGHVVHIEERETRKGGTFHVVSIEEPGGEVVPVPFFGRAPGLGETVEVTGKLGSRNGFLCLIPDRKRESEGDPSRRWKTSPSGCEQRRGRRVGKPVTDHFEDDGSLPF